MKIQQTNPKIGIKKKGELAEVYVHKFKMNKSLHLLVYTWVFMKTSIVLLS